MNTSILLTILVSLTCIILFLVMRRRNKKEDPFLRKFLNYAESQGTRISQYDILHNLAIGLSDSDNIVFLLKKIDDDDLFSHVLLTDVQRCIVNKTIRNSKDGKYTAIERIQLIFYSQDKNKPDSIFELYNLEHSLSVGEEFQIAEKWQKVIMNKLQLLKKESLIDDK